MTKNDGVASKVESYLDRVRAALCGLPERQIDDIMRELRAHAIELAEGKGIEAAFASLGEAKLRSIAGYMLETGGKR